MTDALDAGAGEELAAEEAFEAAAGVSDAEAAARAGLDAAFAAEADAFAADDLGAPHDEEDAPRASFPPASLRPEAPLLSADESAALMDAIRSGAALEERTRSAELGAADQPMRRALRKADEVAPRLLASLTGGLLRAGCTPLDAACEASAVVPYENLAETLSGSAVSWSVSTSDAPDAPLATVTLSPALASTLLERRLGAPDTLAQATITRAPSSIERRVLEPIARELAQATVPAFVRTGTTLVLTPWSRERDQTSRFAPCLRISVRAGLRSGSVVESQVALFSSSFSPRGAALGTARTAVEESLGGVEVELVALLGRCNATVRGLVSLDVGSVLRLDAAPDRPVEVCVDGVPVLRGMPARKDGNLAIEVTT